MPYLLDTNVFIQAQQLHYGMDFCPAFWEWLIHKNAEGVVFSIEKVGDELAAIDDDLAGWTKHRGARFFLKPDPTLISAFKRVTEWAQQQTYTTAAVNTFSQGADFYLVSHALAHGMTVVTHETPTPSIYKLKIPDACVGVNVKVMTPFQMLRHERARFVLRIEK